MAKPEPPDHPEYSFGGSRLGDSRAGIRHAPKHPPAPNPTSAHIHKSPLVHILPVTQTADVLHAALRGDVSVHLCSGWTNDASTSYPSKEGDEPSADVKVAVLAAALRGEIPVRSITTAKCASPGFAEPIAQSTSAGVTEISCSRISSGRSSSNGSIGDGSFRGPGLGTLMRSFGPFSEPSCSEREFEFDGHDQEARGNTCDDWYRVS
jgi:hypothetical protein